MKSVYQIINTRQFSSTRGLSALQSALKQNFYNSEQVALQESVKKIVEETINPFADQWDKDKIFPAKEVYKKFGEAGLLGIHRPTEYGGQGLSYKYNVAFIEALGHSKSAGAAMAIGNDNDDNDDDFNDNENDGEDEDDNEFESEDENDNLMTLKMII